MSQKKNQHTKQGVKQLSMDDTLFNDSENEIESEKNFDEMLEDSFSQKPVPDTMKNMKNKTKQGVDQLTMDDALFADSTKNIGPEKSFKELVDESFSDESNRALIKEKITTASDKIELSKNSKLNAYPEPQDEIDLHGLHGDEAELKTDFFIRDSNAKGLSTIRIIVGKGTHSEGRAVLPDIIEGKVIDLKGEGQILSFKWEKGKKLRSGAIIIYLKK